MIVGVIMCDVTDTDFLLKIKHEKPSMIHAYIK